MFHSAVREVSRRLVVRPTVLLGRWATGGAQTEPHFLHIAPSGDWWQGPAIYAAKHNPSNYVKSLEIPEGHTVDLDDVEEKQLHAMYDDEIIPASVLVPLETR